MKDRHFSPFDSGRRVVAADYTPEALDRQRQAFLARGGKIQVVDCAPRPKETEDEFTKHRRRGMNQIRLKGSKDGDGNPLDAA